MIGSQALLAKALGVPRAQVNQWVRKDGQEAPNSPPILHCVAIEKVTHGAVRRWELRPDDWHRIWPELIGAEGAPAINGVAA